MLLTKTEQIVGRTRCQEPDVKRSRHSTITPFKFKEHCLLCGEQCSSEPDSKNPERWRRVVQCRTADRGHNQDTLKDVILKACDARNDEWAQQVRIRVEGAVSDLHAADAQCHKDCMSTFRGPRNNLHASHKPVQVEDEAFNRVIHDLNEDRTRIWNSIELHEQYIAHGGEPLMRRNLMSKLSDHFGHDILVLSGAGVASILSFRSKASSVLKLVGNDEDDDDAAVSKVAKLIAAETKTLKHDKSKYQTRVSLENSLDVTCAPDDVLTMIRCGCRSITPCATAKCSCSAADSHVQFSADVTVQKTAATNKLNHLPWQMRIRMKTNDDILG